MAESLSTQNDYEIESAMSPDLFAEYDNPFFDVPDTPKRENVMEVDTPPREPEPVEEDTQEWKGVSMDEIYKGLGPFGHHHLPPIRSSEQHAVLFKLSIPNRGPPKPHPSQPVDKWHVNFVRMPFSAHCMYPTNDDVGKPKEFRVRWKVIQEALLQSFVSSLQLEVAILSYNNKYAPRWNFSALHHFFEEVIDEEETNIFFEKLLPKIVQLALQLPTLVTGPIPLLKQHKNTSISLSQLQVASLLANAFFCTFPRRNSRNPQAEYGSYPHINFNGLFSAHRDDKIRVCVAEKLKCIFHYFRRVTTSAPEGTITIQRRYVPKEACPKWEKINEQLPPLHITSKGTIETEGVGLLQVDFANKFLGGGVLYFGCVQEEIRFVICPELIVTMLVAEVLDDTEALIISGVERYSNYEGYANDFKWAGNFVDETPRDNSGRRKTSVVAIDALRFTQAEKQFNLNNVTRELNKAFVGFSSSELSKNDLSAIATGNWGCGAFRGNPKLKVLIQLMAAAVCGRPIVYFTFGDKDLRDTIVDMYWYLINNNVDVGRLYTLLRAYENESSKAVKKKFLDFYQFLYNKAKLKTFTDYFSEMSNKNTELPKSQFTIIKTSQTKPSSIERATFTSDEDEQKLKQKLLSEKVDDGEENMEITKNVSAATKKNKIINDSNDNQAVGTTKKKSLWDIFSEKESDRDRASVSKSPTSDKQLIGLKLLNTQPPSISNDSDTLCNNNDSTFPSTPTKSITNVVDITSEFNVDNKVNNNLSLKRPQQTPIKLSPSSSGKTCGQKKIVDFFAPNKRS